MLMTALSRWPLTSPFSTRQRTSTYCSFGMDLLQEASGNDLSWKFRLLDLSPIKHVRNMIVRRLSALHRSLQTLAQLIYKVHVVWYEMLQVDIDYFILSMPRCVQNCTQLRGR